MILYKLILKTITTLKVALISGPTALLMCLYSKKYTAVFANASYSLIQYKFIKTVSIQ